MGYVGQLLGVAAKEVLLSLFGFSRHVYHSQARLKAPM